MHETKAISEDVQREPDSNYALNGHFMSHMHTLYFDVDVSTSRRSMPCRLVGETAKAYGSINVDAKQHAYRRSVEAAPEFCATLCRFVKRSRC
jgi:hypothetical protein